MARWNLAVVLLLLAGAVLWSLPRGGPERAGSRPRAAREVGAEGARVPVPTLVRAQGRAAALGLAEANFLPWDGRLEEPVPEPDPRRTLGFAEERLLDAFAEGGLHRLGNVAALADPDAAPTPGEEAPTQAGAEEER